MASYDRFEKVLRNVDKLSSMSDVTDAEMNQYLQSEGYSIDRFTKAANSYAKAKGIKSDYGNIEAAIQGAMFGFGDEWEAAIKTLKNKKPYEQNLAAVQFAKQEYEAESPIKSTAFELAGSIPTAFLGAAKVGEYASKVPQFQKIISSIPTSVKAITGISGAGAATGAVTGAGTAQPGERVEGAQKGAVQGAILAPVAFAGIKSGTNVAKFAAEKLGIPDMAKAVVDATKNIPVVKDITGKTAEFFGLGEDAVQRKADIKIIQALQRDNLNVQQVRDAIDVIRKSGYKPETIMEYGGKATKQLGETVASYPAARAVAENMAEERKSGAANRILGDFQNAFKIGEDPAKIADALIETRGKISAPLYEAAYSQPVAIESKTIDKYMGLMQFKEAYKKAQALAEYDSFPLPDLKTSGNVFDLKTLDYIKRGLDDVIYNGKSPTSGIGKEELRKLKEARSGFMKEVDSVAPVEYKQARDAYAGATQVYDAIDNGRSFFDVDARNLKTMYEKMSPSERDGYAIGAYDAIRAKVREGADGIDQVRRTFGSPEKRDQIRTLIGDDAFNTLETQLGREKNIRSTDIKMLGGSQTQPRTVAQQEFEGSTDLLPSISQKGIVKGSMDYMLRSLTSPGGQAAEKIAPELYSVDPAQQAKLLDRLGLLDEYLKKQALQQQIGSGAVGGSPSLLD